MQRRLSKLGSASQRLEVWLSGKVSAYTGSGEEGEGGTGNADTQESCSRPNSSSKHIKGLWVRGYRASRELMD